MPEVPGRIDPADTFGGVDPSPQTPPPATGLRRYLITIPDHVRMHTWLPELDAFPMELHVRADGDNRETWSTTIVDDDAPGLLAAAGRLGITVEEVVGTGEHEAYELRVGEPGTGWTSGADLDPDTVDRVAESARRAGRAEPLEIVGRLSAELWREHRAECGADDAGGLLGGRHVDPPGNPTEER